MSPVEDFPVDVVVTWVDGSDEGWVAERARYERSDSSIADDWAKGAIRFRDWNTLRYWFRGIEQNMPWVRYVHFVTYGHIPSWLDERNPHLRIVRHEDFIPSRYLPTFNSHTIELNFHRIPELAEHFVYFNDDVYALRPLAKSDLFKRGLPCDFAALNAPSRDRHNKLLMEVNNVAVINRHFRKNKVLRDHFFKWFNPKYGAKMLRTLCLLPWPRFTGFIEQHTVQTFLKSTFETLWKEEYDELDATCLTKFRAYENVTPWLIRDWQLVSGSFAPSDLRGRRYFKQSIDADMLAQVFGGQYSVVCINDVATAETFLSEREALVAAFDGLFPNKSSFER